jgi:hypothetical protein
LRWTRRRRPLRRPSGLPSAGKTVILSYYVLPDLRPLEWLAVARGAAPAHATGGLLGVVHLDELQELARDWRVAAELAKPLSPAQLQAAVRDALR